MKSCNGIIPNGENDIKVDRITIINSALQILEFVPLPFTLSYEHIFTAFQIFLLLNDAMVPALFMNMTLFVMSRNFIKCYIDSLLNLACSFLSDDTRVVWQVSDHVSKERTASIFTGSQRTTMYMLMLCTFCALSSSVRDMREGGGVIEFDIFFFCYNRIFILLTLYFCLYSPVNLL